MESSDWFCGALSSRPSADGERVSRGSVSSVTEPRSRSRTSRTRRTRSSAGRRASAWRSGGDTEHSRESRSDSSGSETRSCRPEEPKKSGAGSWSSSCVWRHTSSRSSSSRSSVSRRRRRSSRRRDWSGSGRRMKGFGASRRE